MTPIDEAFFEAGRESSVLWNASKNDSISKEMFTGSFHEPLPDACCSGRQFIPAYGRSDGVLPTLILLR